MMFSEGEVNVAWERVFGPEGGVLLVRDCPAGLEFGFDCITHETASKFQGISMIPSGLHFVYYSHINFPRQGFFVKVDHHHKLLHHVFNRELEELEATDCLPSPSRTRLQQSIIAGEYNEYLASYTQRLHHVWQNISHFINEELLRLCRCPVNVALSPGEEEDDTLLSKIANQYKTPTNSQAVDLHVAEYTKIHELENVIVQMVYRSPDDALEKITVMKLDKSWLLDEIVRSRFQEHWYGVLGELQLSFIMFIMLYSFPGLNHWKLLFTTICASEVFLQQHEDFTQQFIHVIFHQLKFIPEDFFGSEISKENFLLPALTALFSALNYRIHSETLAEHKRRFENFILKKFGISVVDMEIEGNVLEGNVSDSFCATDLDGAGDFWEMEDSVSNELFAAYRSRRVARQEQYNEVVDNNPSSEHPLVDINQPFASRAEREGMKYSWRYPLLFEAMTAAEGREDLIMTAMRILDESETVDPSDQVSPLAKSRNEAIHFLENEAQSLY